MIQNTEQRSGLDQDTALCYTIQDHENAVMIQEDGHLSLRDVLMLICEGFNLR